MSNAVTGDSLVEGGVVFELDLYVMIKLAVRCYESFSARSNRSKPEPLMPHEVEALEKFAEGFRTVTKHAYRLCHDGRAFCRYREGPCCFSPEELRAEGAKAIVLSCKYRGKAHNT